MYYQFENQQAEHRLRSQILDMFGEVEIPFKHYMITVSTRDYIIIRDVNSQLQLYSEDYNNLVLYMLDNLATFNQGNLLAGVTNE